jgi:hypothetical protein
MREREKKKATYVTQMILIPFVFCYILSSTPHISFEVMEDRNDCFSQVISVLWAV